MFVEFGWLLAVLYAALYAVDYLLWQSAIGLYLRVAGPEALIPRPDAVRAIIFAAAGSLAILITWSWARTAVLGDVAFAVLAGWLILPEVPRVMQRLRSLLELRRLIRGRVAGEGGRLVFVPLPWRRVATETLAFAAVLLACWLVFRGWFLIGGAAGSLVLAGREWDRATRLR